MEGIPKLCIFLLTIVQGLLALDGNKVFSMTPKSRRDVEAVKHIVEELGDEVTLWNDLVFLNRPVNVDVPPDMADALSSFTQKHGIESRLLMKDLGQAMRDQVETRTPVINPLTDFAFDQYHTLEEIENWMLAMVQEHKDVAELVTIGYSYELHPIYAFRISTDLNGTKPVIWLDAGIHAREWVAPATMVFFINKFLDEYETNEVLNKSLETHDWYFMPVYNVDGYKFTWIEDENGTLINRMWRKTRTPNPGTDCVGTDPNRNWDRKWGTTSGISFNPCSDAFCGSSPWSEPSVRQVGFFLRDKIDLDIYFAYHSFGQFFMLPYGYTSEESKDYAELMDVCARGIAKVKAVHGMDYKCDSLYNLVYENSGSSVDYVYDVIGTKFSFGVELRDNGTHMFILPPDQIVPTAEENFPFVLQVVEDFMNQKPSGSSKLTISLIHLLSFVFLTKL